MKTKKQALLIFCLCIGSLLGFQSCSDDDKEVKLKAVEKEVSIDATAYDKWVYFSFEKGAILEQNSPVDASIEGKDWDIAFHRWDIRLNSGESGKGEAGAFLLKDKMGKTGWDAVVEAPDGDYIVDTTIAVTKAMGQRGPVKIEVPANTLITGGSEGTWMTFKVMGPGNYTSEILNQIFVVKTASGKYAKIWLKQYTNSEKKGGNITMKYAYQKDGSTLFN